MTLYVSSRKEMKQELTMVWHGAIMGSDILFKNINLLFIYYLLIYCYCYFIYFISWTSCHAMSARMPHALRPRDKPPCAWSSEARLQGARSGAPPRSRAVVLVGYGRQYLQNAKKRCSDTSTWPHGSDYLIAWSSTVQYKILFMLLVLFLMGQVP